MAVQAWTRGFRRLLIVPGTLLTLGLGADLAMAQLYKPIDLPANNMVSDILSKKDIPTGQGGFARDYVTTFQEGDQIAIDLASDTFDTIVTLLAEDGTTVAENDDGPDGTTNSLLFTRITKTGTYIVRVRSFGEVAGGPFDLKVTRLRPI